MVPLKLSGGVRDSTLVRGTEGTSLNKNLQGFDNPKITCLQSWAAGRLHLSCKTRVRIQTSRDGRFVIWALTPVHNRQNFLWVLYRHLDGWQTLICNLKSILYTNMSSWRIPIQGRPETCVQKYNSSVTLNSSPAGEDSATTTLNDG